MEHVPPSLRMGKSQSVVGFRWLHDLHFSDYQVSKSQRAISLGTRLRESPSFFFFSIFQFSIFFSRVPFNTFRNLETLILEDPARTMKVAASTIAVLQPSELVISSCKSYIDGYQDYPKAIRLIYHEKSSIRAVFETLRFLDPYDPEDSRAL